MEQKIVENKNTYSNVFREILRQEKPFCLVDIVNRLKERGITDEGLILHVLDKAFADGFVDYREIKDKKTGYEGWAFVVVEE